MEPMSLAIETPTRQNVTKPLQPRTRQNDRVPVIGDQFPQARRDVAAKFHQLKVRPFPSQLVLSTNTASGNECVSPKRREMPVLFHNQNVIDWCPRKGRANLKPRRHVAW